MMAAAAAIELATVDFDFAAAVDSYSHMAWVVRVELDLRVAYCLCTRNNDKFDLILSFRIDGVRCVASERAIIHT